MKKRKIEILQVEKRLPRIFDLPFDCFSEITKYISQTEIVFNLLKTSKFFYQMLTNSTGFYSYHSFFPNLLFAFRAEKVEKPIEKKIASIPFVSHISLTPKRESRYSPTRILFAFSRYSRAFSNLIGIEIDINILVNYRNEDFILRIPVSVKKRIKRLKLLSNYNLNGPENEIFGKNTLFGFDNLEFLSLHSLLFGYFDTTNLKKITHLKLFGRNLRDSETNHGEIIENKLQRLISTLESLSLDFSFYTIEEFGQFKNLRKLFITKISAEDKVFRIQSLPKTLDILSVHRSCNFPALVNLIDNLELLQIEDHFEFENTENALAFLELIEQEKIKYLIIEQYGNIPFSEPLIEVKQFFDQGLQRRTKLAFGYFKEVDFETKFQPHNIRFYNISEYRFSQFQRFNRYFELETFTFEKEKLKTSNYFHFTCLKDQKEDPNHKKNVVSGSCGNCKLNGIILKCKCCKKELCYNCINSKEEDTKKIKMKLRDFFCLDCIKNSKKAFCESCGEYWMVKYSENKIITCSKCAKLGCYNCFPTQESCCYSFCCSCVDSVRCKNCQNICKRIKHKEDCYRLKIRSAKSREKGKRCNFCDIKKELICINLNCKESMKRCFRCKRRFCKDCGFQKKGCMDCFRKCQECKRIFQKKNNFGFSKEN